MTAASRAIAAPPLSHARAVPATLVHRLELRVVDRRLDLRPVNLVRVFRKRREQRLVGEDVDAPRQPFGRVADQSAARRP